MSATGQWKSITTIPLMGLDLDFGIYMKIYTSKTSTSQLNQDDESTNQTNPNTAAEIPHRYYTRVLSSPVLELM